MTSNQTQIEPNTIRGKTTLNWVRTIKAIVDNAGNIIASALASDGFSAVYELRNKSKFYSISTTGNGNEYTVSESATVTRNYAGGEYGWELYLINGTDRWLVDSGELTVIAYTAGVADLRSQVKRTLDAIDAMIEGRASKDVQEYTIQTGSGSRSLKHFSAPELIQLRSHYAALYRNEQAKLGRNKSIIKPRFCNR